MKQNKLLKIFIITGILFISCTPERDWENPYDPQGDNLQHFYIGGTVTLKGIKDPYRVYICLFNTKDTMEKFISNTQFEILFSYYDFISFMYNKDNSWKIDYSDYPKGILKGTYYMLALYRDLAIGFSYYQKYGSDGMIEINKDRYDIHFTISSNLPMVNF